ncbi:MAG: hypothetical protein LBH17_02815 [Oscillospiraceae bacterium]|jgi:hypothetical protein|nr:hypothetical protein [Oscillospiraceae bacterium]
MNMMKKLMNMKKREKSAERTESERYIASMHSLGRAGALGAAAIILAMPIMLGLLFDALPSVGAIAQAALPLLMIFLPSNLFEVIMYTPVLGSSIYLTLITGEVMNLKLPVVNSVLDAMKAEAGTEEADVLTTIAVCTASLVTAIVVAIGVALMVPLKPVMTSAAMKTASANIVPALFGALLAGIVGKDLGGGVTARGKLWGMVPAAIIVAVITVFDTQLSVLLHLDRLLGRAGDGVIMASLQGFVIIAMMPITHFFSKWLYKKGYLRIALPGETITRRVKNRR